ncbi:MAG: galactose mutarotase [Muribaculaceae bacterium]|nr:galactose mutarotase [Muribaculaceae bacterium]
MEVQSHKYPAPCGEITLVRLTNSRGGSVLLSSLGAGIVAVQVPDRDGKIENVLLSYENPADYMSDGPCMGKTAGRYANRIAEGRFEIDGKSYQLDLNLPPHHLHGGATGFQNQIWDTELFSNGVRFTLHSPDGHEHYPGNLTATVEYRWSDDNELSILLDAESDAPTVANLTNHAYWNLDGADSGRALDQTLRIKASRWLPTDPTLIPTGEMAPVAGTPMDFMEEKKVGRDIDADFPALKYGKGYDNCWVLDRESVTSEESDGARVIREKAMVKDAVVLKGARSGRELHIDTDQPGVQIYTGNWLAGSPKNPSGRSYEDYDGVAIEAQGLPDAPNQPGFPSQRVDPAHPMRRTIIYRFVTEN